MIWAFVICFLLIVVFLFNFKRRMRQGNTEMAGLNLFAALAVTIAAIILTQFV